MCSHAWELKALLYYILSTFTDDGILSEFSGAVSEIVLNE